MLFRSGRSFFNISPVFRLDFLGIAALPPELRKLALARLSMGKLKYQGLESTPLTQFFINSVDRFIQIFDATPHNPQYVKQFVDYIKLEDTASSKPLSAVVPEWAPYFQS